MINPDIQLSLELDPNQEFITLSAKSPLIESFMKTIQYKEDPFEYTQYDMKLYNLQDESYFNQNYKYYIKNLHHLTRMLDEDECEINLSILRMQGLSNGVFQTFDQIYTDRELQLFTEKTQRILDKITQSIMFTKVKKKAEFKIKVEYREWIKMKIELNDLELSIIYELLKAEDMINNLTNDENNIYDIDVKNLKVKLEKLKWV